MFYLQTICICILKGDNKPREVSLIGEGDTREDRKIDTQQRRTEEMQSSTPSKLFKPNEDSKG